MGVEIVYESAWGNTQAVAEAVGAALAEVTEVRVTEVGRADPLDRLECDLLVVGAPTHAFGLSRPETRDDARRRAGHEIVSAGIGVREWVAAAGRCELRVATFDTHVRRPNLPGHAGRAAARALRRVGCRVVADPESFDVADYDGPLLPGELTRAWEWGARLGRQLVPVP